MAASGRRAAPIGIFDSGIGGLSVLRHVRALLPAEDLIYFADAGFAPYGDKPEAIIVARALAIAAFLQQFQVKAIVVACNTATAAAIEGLRTRYPQLQVIGVEPGLKPAAAQTQSKVVGVLATGSTLASSKFLALQQQIAASSGVRFVLQACSGLADQIEKGELHSRETASMVQRYVAPLLAQDADTLVLGCTHYPFVQHLIEQVVAAAGRPVGLIDTGAAVARHLQHLLQQNDLAAGPAHQAAAYQAAPHQAAPHQAAPHKAAQLTGQSTAQSAGQLMAYTTGSRTALTRAFSNLLGLMPTVEQVHVAADGAES